MSKRLKEISKIIQAKKDWTLDQLGSQIGYSRVQLGRLFNKENTEEFEKMLMSKYPEVFQIDTQEVPKEEQKKDPEGSDDAYRAKYIKKLEDENALLIELVRNNQDIIKTNLTLVLATVRTISVRQEATGSVALESLARLEKKKDQNALVLEGDRRRGQIEREARKHGTTA